MLPDPRHIATAVDPQPLLDEIASCPAHRAADGVVVVGRPPEVVELLESRDAVVLPPAVDPGPLAELVAGMARFSEGDARASRRAEVEELLGDVDVPSIRAAARRQVREVTNGVEVVDVAPLARTIPVHVLADALGVADPDGAVGAVDALCRRLAPMLGAPTRPDDATVVASLTAAIGPLGESWAVGVVAVLFQAMDATAALVAQLLLDSEAPPIVLTTRSTTTPMQVGAVEVAAGETLVLLLPTTSVSGVVDLSFGHGRHRCPGREIALALAETIASTLVDDGFRMVAPPAGWEPRPNLRIPTSLILMRGPGPTGPRSS